MKKPHLNYSDEVFIMFKDRKIDYGEIIKNIHTYVLNLYVMVVYL